MLKRINITQFRSCHGVILDDLGPVTALVGRNGAGKTNVLKAIEWVASGATSATPPFKQLVMGVKEVSVEVDIEGKTYRYSIVEGGKIGDLSWVIREKLAVGSGPSSPLKYSSLSAGC